MEEHLKLVYHAAYRWWAAIQKMGLGLELDDLVQESYIAFMSAERSFDATKGFAFSTYFMTCAKNHFSLLLQQMGRSYAVSAQIDEETSLIDSLTDEQHPEGEVEAVSELQARLNTLSPLSQLVVTLLMSPPAELSQEFQALQAKREQARKAGTNERYPNEMTHTFICSLLKRMGASHAQLATVKDELRHLEGEYV